MTMCKLAQILADANEAEAEVLQRAIVQTVNDNEDYLWSADKLAIQINKTRFSVGSTTIKEHRRNECVCFR